MRKSDFDKKKTAKKGIFTESFLYLKKGNISKKNFDCQVPFLHISSLGYAKNLRGRCEKIKENKKKKPRSPTYGKHKNMLLYIQRRYSG